MADYKHICIFDFETGGLDTSSCEILQIGACILNANSHKIVDTFQTKVCPDHPELVNPEALAVNGLTLEELKNAPPASVIFPVWIDWIKKYNTDKNKTSWGAPIPGGWNIDGFDMPILARYCKDYGYWDEKWNSITAMNPIFTFDVMKYFWAASRTNRDVKNCKLVTAVEYMGLATAEEIEEHAHDAVWDVEMTAKIGGRFLNFFRKMTQVIPETGERRLKMKNCFVEKKPEVANA